MTSPLASAELMVEFEDVTWLSKGASAEGRRKVMKEERMRLLGSEVSLGEGWCLGQLC